MLDPDQEDIDPRDALAAAEEESGVFIWLAYGVFDLLGTAAAWSARPLEEVLEAFPRRMAIRLEEIEVADAALIEWESMYPDD